MAKNAANKPRSAKKEDELTLPMKLFLAGCLAELYLMILRRFYINGTGRQVLAWYDVYLPLLIWVGLGLFVVGGALWLQKKYPAARGAGRFLVCAGVFLILVNELSLWNMSVISLLLILIPVLVLLAILWQLYDRECALALTVLGLSLLALWGYRRYVPNLRYGALVRAALIVYLVLVLALALLAYLRKLEKLLPAHADKAPVYLACALSAAALIVALVSVTAAYYAMWVLALLVFALAVYYTVKQL
ncbi:MAG: hypothetical protein IKN53_00200 [Oscillibacter sp.]|nr:hypothetical protein [Oscillibacter sp.]